MKSILKLVFKYFNVKGLLLEIVDDKLEAEIDRLVARTDNAWDDSFKAMMYPVIEKELKEKINELDFEKILGL